jgi:hypothetical protein
MRSYDASKAFKAQDQTRVDPNLEFAPNDLSTYKDLSSSVTNDLDERYGRHKVNEFVKLCAY